MSKIERALRKAEEEKQKRPADAPAVPTDSQNLLATTQGLVGAQELPADFTMLSEHFRKIAARLRLCCESAGVNDVVFTSAVSGEGKTTSVLNCAISLCQDFNHSVCLVDCDLRNPRISEYFRADGSAGIEQVLRGEVGIEMAVHSTSSVGGLSIVHSRSVGRRSLNLLSTDGLGRIVQYLRKRFDFVLFDSPPVLPVADTTILLKQVSRGVLVIESGRTRRKHIEQIFEQVEAEKIMGFIMNYKRHRLPETYKYSKYYHYGEGGTTAVEHAAQDNQI